MIRPFGLAALCLLPSHAVSADDATAQIEADVLSRLIDATCIDLHPSEGCEQVFLLASTGEPDGADLLVLTERRSEPPGAPLLVARGIAFNGPFWGMRPGVERSDDGALLLRSEQTGVGRHPWYQALTIAHVDGAFMVTGFHYSSYDRAQGGAFVCDMDLVTGAYTVEATAIRQGTEDEVSVVFDQGRDAPAAIPAVDWTRDHGLPAVCEAGFQRFLDH